MRERRRLPGGDPQRGSLSVEFAIVMGAALVGFTSLLIVAGRILQQEGDVRSAARAAARAASLRQYYDDAAVDAVAVAEANLVDRGASCEDLEVAIVSSPADFTADGWVTVEVACTARSIGGLGLGDRHYRAQATEVIDTYRSDP